MRHGSAARGVSNLGARIEMHRVPLSMAAPAVVATDLALLALALTGGDDYEILFTAPASAKRTLLGLSAATDVPITEIGQTVSLSPGEDVRVETLDAMGQPVSFEREGWTHS